MNLKEIDKAVKTESHDCRCFGKISFTHKLQTILFFMEAIPMIKKMFILTLLLALTMMLLPGCTCPSRVQVQADKPAAKPIQASPGGVVYPCDGCGVLKVEKMMPAEVQLGKPFDYYITVTNLYDRDLSGVELNEYLADNFKYVSSQPEGKLEGKMLSWVMPKVKSGQVEKVKVTGIATTSDAITQCATAKYKMPACAMTKVVEPKLTITKTATEKITACQKAAIEYTVTNNGTGITKDVKIAEAMPAGLVSETGASKIEIPVGNLAPGESKKVVVMAMPKKTGVFASKAIATAAGDLSAESAETKTVVTKPVLEIAKSGKEEQYLGRQVSYDIKVTNNGDSDAVNTVVEDTMPIGAKLVSASMGGTADVSKVVWNLGTIAPQASKTVNVVYMPSGIGKVGGQARAMAECAEAVAASAMTDIKGISALLLEVIDVDDPIEVGQNEAYKIIVTNQGSAAATNIAIKAMIEDTMQFVSATGATNGTIADSTISMAPLASLAPKAQAIWHVNVKAIKAGDVRFKVVMNADQLDRDVEETESTHFYQ